MGRLSGRSGQPRAEIKEREEQKRQRPWRAWTIAGILLTIAVVSTANDYTFTDDPNPHLNLWLKMDENAGTSAGDSSGFGSTGTLVNGAAWATGQYGSAIDCDGTNDHVTVADADNVGWWGNQLTIDFWFQRQASADHRGIVYKGDYWVGMTGGSIVFRKPDFSGEITGGSVGVANVWTHFALTYNGTHVVIYQNGTEASRTAMSGSFPNQAGTLFLCSDPNGGTFLDMAIDNLRTFNRPMSAWQVRNQLYNNTLNATGIAAGGPGDDGRQGDEASNGTLNSVWGTVNGTARESTVLAEWASGNASRERVLDAIADAEANITDQLLDPAIAADTARQSTLLQAWAKVNLTYSFLDWYVGHYNATEAAHQVDLDSILASVATMLAEVAELEQDHDAQAAWLVGQEARGNASRAADLATTQTTIWDARNILWGQGNASRDLLQLEIWTARNILWGVGNQTYSVTLSFWSGYNATEAANLATVLARIALAESNLAADHDAQDQAHQDILDAIANIPTVTVVQTVTATQTVASLAPQSVVNDTRTWRMVAYNGNFTSQDSTPPLAATAFTVDTPHELVLRGRNVTLEAGISLQTNATEASSWTYQLQLDGANIPNCALRVATGENAGVGAVHVDPLRYDAAVACPIPDLEDGAHTIGMIRTHAASAIVVNATHLSAVLVVQDDVEVPLIGGILVPLVTVQTVTVTQQTVNVTNAQVTNVNVTLTNQYENNTINGTGDFVPMSIIELPDMTGQQVGLLLLFLFLLWMCLHKAYWLPAVVSTMGVAFAFVAPGIRPDPVPQGMGWVAAVVFLFVVVIWIQALMEYGAHRKEQQAKAEQGSP